MTEYWKSLPKKYCEVCKCWFTDNKASVEFHEKGFRHKANVGKKLNELQRNGAKQEKELREYNNVLMQIESAAMKSFEKDISTKPELASELSRTNSLINKLPKIEKSSSGTITNRFGECSSTYEEESSTLVHGRAKALDTISNKFKKKSKWLEAKTAEGQTYYWNKETLDTKWEPPKSGFLSIEEQKYYNEETSSDSNPTMSSTLSSTLSSTYKYEPYGKWQSVKTVQYDDKMVDLQLPQQSNQFEINQPIEKHEEREKKIEFKEKTIEPMIKSEKEAVSFTFKKRKNPSEVKRNVRQRGDDD